jgi:hypothetical protein
MRSVLKKMQSKGVGPNPYFLFIFTNSLFQQNSTNIVIGMFNTHLQSNPKLINNLIATCLLRAIAKVGDDDGGLSAWNAYYQKLGGRT